jgi:addiction module HigA family antidote
MLLEEFLKPMGITQRELANSINVPYQRVNEIINGRRGISPSTALRLAKVFGVSADFWMNISCDGIFILHCSQNRMRSTISNR